MICPTEYNGVDSRLGLICGGGRLPSMVAAGARQSGRYVIAVGIRGWADPHMAEVASEFHWSGVLRVGRWIRLLRRKGCHQVILAGSVRKEDMYKHGQLGRVLHFLPDWTSFRLWHFGLADKRPATVLGALVDELAGKGIAVESSVRFNQDALVPEGYLTTRRPSAAQHKDIEFGWKIAREMARLDVGQAVAVKEQDTIAVEAIEGTDRMIERAGALCKAGGWCLIKVSRPDQDMRFDVPTIGPKTIEKMKRNRAKVLCVEAGKTIVVDKEEVLTLAEKYGIAVVGKC